MTQDPGRLGNCHKHPGLTLHDTSDHINSLHTILTDDFLLTCGVRRGGQCWWGACHRPTTPARAGPLGSPPPTGPACHVWCSCSSRWRKMLPDLQRDVRQCPAGLHLDMPQSSLYLPQSSLYPSFLVGLQMLPKGTQLWEFMTSHQLQWVTSQPTTKHLISQCTQNIKLNSDK